MDELMILPKDKDLVAQIHAGGAELPLPFERDILLLAVELTNVDQMSGIHDLFDILEVGERVRLIREPENETDPFSIRAEIINEESRELLDGNCAMGYVPRAHNRPFARLMDAGKYLYGVICHKEIQGNRRRIVMNIILKDDVFIRPEKEKDVYSSHATVKVNNKPGKKAADDGVKAPPVTMDSEELKAIIHAILEAAEKLWQFATPEIEREVLPSPNMLAAVKEELKEFVIYVCLYCDKPVPKDAVRDYIQTEVSDAEIREIAGTFSARKFTDYLNRIPKCFKIWTDIDFDIGEKRTGSPTTLARGYFNAIKSLANLLMYELSPIDETVNKDVVEKLVFFFNMIEVSIAGDIKNKRDRSPSSYSAFFGV